MAEKNLSHLEGYTYFRMFRAGMRQVTSELTAGQAGPKI